MFRIKGHREAGAWFNDAAEWTLLAAAGQSAEFHTLEEAERLVTMCNAALAHAAPRIWYTVEEIEELPANRLADLDKLAWLNSQREEWPADDTGTPLTT